MADINTMLIIIIIIVLLAITYIYWFTDFSKNATLDKYIKALAVVGTLIAIISFYFSYRDSHEASQKQLLLDIVNTDENSIIGTEQLFLKHPKLDQLYKEVYSTDPYVQDSDNLSEIQMMRIMLIKMETAFYTLGGMNQDWLNSERDRPWVNLWITWFKSQKFRQYWNHYKQFVDQELQDFVDQTIIPLAIKD